jgi:LuxR family quorum sensing-dependent transcriptional regulator
MDILQWMAEGKSDWEIGVILKVSEHLVDKISRQLRAKLNATNRTQTVATALRHNLRIGKQPQSALRRCRTSR